MGGSNANLSTFTYSYTPTGQIAAWGVQDDASPVTTSTIAYDNADQVVSVTAPAVGVAPATGVYYAYDSAGNRLSSQSDANINSSQFDAMNQYVAEIIGGNMAFSGTINQPSTITLAGVPATVASDGSWLGSAPVSSGANAIPMAIDAASGSMNSKTISVNVSGDAARAVAYDLDGNVINDGLGKTYQWDAANHLVSIVMGGSTVAFVYDGKGRRVQELVNGIIVKQWVWIGSRPAEERDGASNVTKRFYAQGEEIGSSLFYFTYDHLGSVREMVDSSGAVRARYNYDAYGRTSKISGDLNSDFGFGGNYYDSSLSLGFTLFRVYDPTMGRWLSRDPIGYAGGNNFYSFSGNDPIDKVDPLGLCCQQQQDDLDSANALLSLAQTQYDMDFDLYQQALNEMVRTQADAVSKYVPPKPAIQDIADAAMDQSWDEGKHTEMTEALHGLVKGANDIFELLQQAKEELYQQAEKVAEDALEKERAAYDTLEVDIGSLEDAQSNETALSLALSICQSKQRVDNL